MANSNVGVILVLSAMNRASAVINGMVNSGIASMQRLQDRTSKIADNSMKAGQQMIASGIAVGAPLVAATKAYGYLEEAQLSLKSTMMDVNGRVSAQFANIDKLAIQLGNKLPGTTEDFYQMFDVMMRNGAKAQDILGGTGKAAAYLGVQLKIPYTEAAELAQRLQVATGVANGDMMKFMDTLARVNQLGPSVQEMKMAFMRSAGELKTMKIQGVEAVGQLSNVYAMLIKTMGSGEQVGTGFAAVLAGMGDAKAMEKFNAVAAGMHLNFKFMDKNGDFLGIENMMTQFNKMRNLTTAQKNTLFSALTGAKGADTQIVATLVNEGLAGYRKMEAQKMAQASLDKKVELQLKGLKSQYDAVTGTLKNQVAVIGSALAPQIKAMFDKVNNFLPKIGAWVEKHQTLTIWILKGAAAFSGLALAGGYLSLVIGGVARGVSTVANIMKWGGQAIKAVNFAIFALRYNFVTRLVPAFQAAIPAVMKFGTALLANPLTWYVAGAVAIGAAVYLIIRNWSKITAFFGRLWSGVKTVFKAAWDWIKVSSAVMFNPALFIFQHWDKIGPYFTNLWGGVKKVFGGIWEWVAGRGKAFYDAGVNIVKSIWNGMKTMINRPVEAMAEMVKKMRDYLPFSPAKTGPFRDLHRVKIMETIAGGIKPKPVLNAMHHSLGEISKTVSGGEKPNKRSGGGGGIVFAPVIHLNGTATKEDARLIGDTLEKKFEQLMDKYKRNKERLSFG